MRQEAGHRVEGIVSRYSTSKRRSHHSPYDLSDMSGILCDSLRVEDLGARTIPSCRNGLFREHDTDGAFALNRLGLHPSDLSPSQLEISVFSKDIGYGV